MLKVIYVLCLGLLVSCNSKKDNKSTSGAILPTEKSGAISIGEDPNWEWMHLVNADSDSLAQLYTKDAIQISELGEVTAGAVAIVDNHRKGGYRIDSIKTIKQVKANPDKAYELGRFWTSTGQEYKHLIIWDIGEGKKLRELEFVLASEISPSYIDDIKKRREDWIQLCNEHDATTLVVQLYTKNAVYYNHRPPIIGWEDISQEYRYMNDENYTLFLEPIILEAVNETLAFEIGQCSGTYNGKYVLVWQKNEEGVWRVLMDSNI